MKTMKVSFIIPIYKVELYLEQCVNSILNQTYRDIEVILVDDGSPDRCPALCDAYVQKDSRIKVLHKPNGGLSDARNLGLRVATGEYVIFVDGDDFWTAENHLEELIKTVHENLNCDFVGFNCSYFYPDSDSYTTWVPYSDTNLFPRKGDEALISLVQSGTFPMSACLKVIKKEFLITNALYFEKGILAEDIPWFINVLEKCNRCLFVNQYIYAYRQNVAGSITNSGGERSFNNLFTILKSELSKIETRSLNDPAKKALFSFLAYEYCILLSAINDLHDAKAKRKELYTYKWLLQYTDNPKVKMSAIVCRFLGIRMTEKFLCLYNRRRQGRRLDLFQKFSRFVIAGVSNIRKELS